MTVESAIRCAVLGSPITHSKSPALHRAAYGVLGLEWQYDAIEVTETSLRAFVGSLDEHWRGLSLTMPLKRAILPLLTDADELVELTGGANTVVLGNGMLRGYNTDVTGIVRALMSHGVRTLDTVLVLGGGATAASAIAAVAELGAHRVHVAVRTPANAARLTTLGSRLGIDVEVADWSRGIGATEPELVVSTLPGGVRSPIAFGASLRTASALFDVAYDPWPSTLAAEWLEVGGIVVPGLEMLAQQALAQVRAFVSGSPDSPVDDESAVFAAMRSAVGLPPLVA